VYDLLKSITKLVKDVKDGADKTVIIGDLLSISANAALAIKNCAIPINPEKYVLLEEEITELDSESE